MAVKTFRFVQHRTGARMGSWAYAVKSLRGSTHSLKVISGQVSAVGHFQVTSAVLLHTILSYLFTGPFAIGRINLLTFYCTLNLHHEVLTVTVIVFLSPEMKEFYHEWQHSLHLQPINADEVQKTATRVFKW